MKRSLLFLSIALLPFTSCKKNNSNPEEQEERKPEVIVKAITESLVSADSISVFTAALKSLPLTTEETAQGITVFAPLNVDPNKVSSVPENYDLLKVEGSSSRKSVNDTGNPITLPDSIMRHQIIKGIYKLIDLTDGKILTGLSGKQLKVTRTGNNIWINGIRIGGKEILSTNNEVVYTVNSNFSGTSTVTVISPPPFSEREFLTALQAIDNSASTWHKNMVVLDGLLSHQAVIDSIPQSFRSINQNIGTFNFSPTDPAINSFWNQGFNTIVMINAIEQQAPAVMTTRAERLARLKTLKAYIYLQLTSYFGKLSKFKGPNLIEESKASMCTYIRTLLQQAVATLPDTSSTSSINAFTVRVLQAKTELLEKNYARVEELTSAVINSNKYPLEPNTTKFSATSSELIWNNTAGMNANFTAYFFNRSLLPYLRMTEVYLMNMEANLALGNNVKAQNSYNLLLQRSGAASDVISMAKLRTFWNAEMRREGSAFTNMTRWETAAATLAPNGFIAGKNNVLPIPVSVIQQNPGITQNPGY